MRPIYETPDNRSNEHAVAVVFAGVSQCELVRLAPLSAWDYTFTRGGVPVAFVEVKCRKNASTKYADYMISASKVDELAKAANTANVAGVLLVQWHDRLGWLRIDTIDRGKLRYGTGGRFDRNDSLDVERVVFFPVNAFTFWTSPNPSSHTPPTS
jgi:hypothetical protein